MTMLSENQASKENDSTRDTRLGDAEGGNKARVIGTLDMNAEI